MQIFKGLVWVSCQRLKVKSPDFCIPPLTGKPEQQWFTRQSGVLISISNRQCTAAQLATAHYPNQRTFDTLSAARQTHQPLPTMFSWQQRTIFVASITRY